MYRRYALSERKGQEKTTKNTHQIKRRGGIRKGAGRLARSTLHLRVNEADERLGVGEDPPVEGVRALTAGRGVEEKWRVERVLPLEMC